jgi:hypothetical protein
MGFIMLTHERGKATHTEMCAFAYTARTVVIYETAFKERREDIVAYAMLHNAVAVRQGLYLPLFRVMYHEFIVTRRGVGLIVEPFFQSAKIMGKIHFENYDVFFVTFALASRFMRGIKAFEV